MQTQNFQYPQREMNDLAAVFQWNYEAQGPTTRADVLMLSNKICENRNALPLACLYETMILSHQMSVTNHHQTTMRRMLSHPRICCDLGELFLREGHLKLARHAFCEGASFGLHYSPAVDDDMFLAAVGSCFMYLLTAFPFADKEVVETATALAYAHLTHCINLGGDAATKALHNRAVLLANHREPAIVQKLILRLLERRVLPDSMIISDYFNAAIRQNDIYAADKILAIQMQKELLSVFGMNDVRTASLEATLSDGAENHISLIRMIDHYARNGYFNLEIQQLQSLNR